MRTRCWIGWIAGSFGRGVILRDNPGDPLYESNKYDFGRTFMEHLRAEEDIC